MKLKKFDLNTIADASTICFSAKRNSGKSFLIRDILHTKRHFPVGMVLAPTDKMTEFYTSFVPDVFVHYEYRSELLSNLFQRQSDMIEKNMERRAKGKKALDTRAFLVMDDCLSSKGDWGKDPHIAEIFFNGRHRHILFLFSMQFPLGLKPEFRSNFDFVFLLADDIMSNQKRLYDHYAGIFPSFEIFRKVFVEVTNNFGCLVINNQVRSNNILDKVFWFKASDPGPFMIGGPRLALYNKLHYDTQWKKRNKAFDVGQYLTMKNRCNVKVEMEGVPSHKKDDDLKRKKRITTKRRY